MNNDTIDFASLLHSSARKADGRVAKCESDIRRLERELQHAKDELVYLEEERMNIDAFVHTYTAPAREYRELTAEFEAMMDATKEEVDTGEARELNVDLSMFCTGFEGGIKAALEAVIVSSNEALVALKKDATKEAAAEIEDDDDDNCGCHLCCEVDDAFKAAAAAEAVAASPSMLNDIGVSAGRLDDIAIGRDVIMPDRKFTGTAEVHFGTIAKDPQ